MLRIKDGSEKLQIISIPIVKLISVILIMILQLGFIISFVNSLQNKAIDDFLGLDWTTRVLDIFIYILPTFFALFFFNSSADCQNRSQSPQ